MPGGRLERYGSGYSVLGRIDKQTGALAATSGTGITSITGIASDNTKLYLPRSNSGGALVQTFQ